MGKYDREYVSEFTHFMADYLAAHPEVVVDQQRGRAIYWDRKIDADAQERADAAAVPVDGYYYFAPPRPAAR